MVVVINTLSTLSNTSTYPSTFWHVGSLVLIFAAEIARCYGSEVTKKAIEHVFSRVNPNVKNIRDILESGGDPRDVTLRSLGGKTG